MVSCSIVRAPALIQLGRAWSGVVGPPKTPGGENNICQVNTTPTPTPLAQRLCVGERQRRQAGGRRTPRLKKLESVATAWQDKAYPPSTTPPSYTHTHTTIIHPTPHYPHHPSRTKKKYGSASATTHRRRGVIKTNKSTSILPIQKKKTPPQPNHHPTITPNTTPNTTPNLCDS